jgi:hypothetical protein
MRFELPGHRFPKNTTSGFSDKFMRTTSFQVSVQKEAFVYSNCVSKSSSCYLLILFSFLVFLDFTGTSSFGEDSRFLPLGLSASLPDLGGFALRVLPGASTFSKNFFAFLDGICEANLWG